MRLYETDEPAWYGTQADAKASGRPFVYREVPTDKPGLLRWLNSNAVSADPVIADIRRDPTPAVVSAPSDNGPSLAFASSDTLTPTAVLEWIEDTATPAQIECVFASLGVRFHEAIKGETT